MTISHELQNLVADLSAAIAAKKPWGRTEQERMRRALTEIGRGAVREESAAAGVRDALGELTRGVAIGVADLDGLARRGAAVLEAGR